MQFTCFTSTDVPILTPACDAAGCLQTRRARRLSVTKERRGGERERRREWKKREEIKERGKLNMVRVTQAERVERLGEREKMGGAGEEPA
jgi:hypothetical protein